MYSNTIDYDINTTFLTKAEKRQYAQIMQDKLEADSRFRSLGGTRPVPKVERLGREVALERSKDCVRRLGDLARINGQREFDAVVALVGDDRANWWLVSLDEELSPLFADPAFDPPETIETWVEFYRASYGEFRAKFPTIPETDIMQIDPTRFTTLCSMALVRGDYAFECRLHGRTLLGCLAEGLAITA